MMQRANERVKKNLFFEIFADVTVDCELVVQIFVVPIIVLRTWWSEEIEE
jgi:hypothetical protein